ncbi:HIRAN domain-containing protein [Niabella drilacis]|uniref:HIRAN domain-containing protein n=1 Tax=Niabella drilacis (strain DSM 25811 / CCM 8410 / CCUG 62505 / LMG 26954 / E90) TaxID=1285928 RepID=A0A1G6Y4D9_NIADE|nr:HIRAN domain-containing protein [Niabella drilacis]SDD84466.1 HIRAN domain-containing protein [Niabella drilacis]
METKLQREYLAHFNIAGFTYWDGALAFEQLKPGVALTLKLEADNKYDPQAVALYYETIKLGYVPKTNNTIIYKLLKLGWNGFMAVVQRVDATEHPEQQVSVVVHLVGGE